MCQLLCRHLVTRKDCCKGCSGRVLRSIQVCNNTAAACFTSEAHLAVLTAQYLHECSRHQHLPACLLPSWLLVAALWTAGQGVPKWRHPACTCIRRRRSGQLCRSCVIKEGAACLAELCSACINWLSVPCCAILLQAHPHLPLPSMHALTVCTPCWMFCCAAGPQVHVPLSG
jgi:hypothetical protein